MLTAAIIGGLLLLSQPASAEDVTVAVSPCVAGPGVPEELARTVGQFVVSALGEMSGVRVVDRALTSTIVAEQDLWLVSQAADALRTRLGPAGANQLLVVSLSDTSRGFVFGLRLVDVATEEVLGSIIKTAPSERQVIKQCEEWTRTFWQGMLAAPSEARSIRPPNDELESLWCLLDESRSRQLLGPELERAESVYRQYQKAIREGKRREEERLSRMASVYLTDCLLLLQRVQNPPGGMVYVPAGWVSMSLHGGKTRRFWVPAFFIDRHETTRGEYARFLKAGGRGEPLDWKPPTEETAKLPVTGVDWYDAEAASSWRGLRPPGHLQYLRAVKSDHEQKYPWGDTWRPEFCVFARDPRHVLLEPVGSRPQGASCWGLLDGVGSVAEWLDSWQGVDYWAHAPEKNPPGPSAGPARLAAGGSYRSGPGGCTCDSVEAITSGTRRDDLGFRCVLPVKESNAGGQ